MIIITFEIFQIFFFWIEGWVGGVNCIQTFFGFLDFFYIYKVPKTSLVANIGAHLLHNFFLISQAKNA